MTTRSGRMRRIVVGAALMPVALVAGLSGEAASLPPQASPTGVAHARTHGPDGLALDPRGPAPAAAYAVDAPAPWDKSEYDGGVFTTDDRNLDLTNLPTFHAVYLYPSDQPSRFAQFAAMFQADAREASAMLNRLYGRGIRFDMRSAAGGGQLLDITVVRSRWKARQLSGGNQFSLVANELAAKGFDSPDKKYVVWLDAGSQACGQGHLYQDSRRSPANANEGRTTAIVYRPYRSDATTGGFCRGRTLLHELGHNMGALQPIAPHSFDDAHCDDSAEDAMCYTSATSADTGDPAFDYNNDDYWDPAAVPVAPPAVRSTVKLPWWTVNLSRFVCPFSGDCSRANTPEY